MSLSRDEIFAFDDLEREAVIIPEWGGQTVWVRVMMGYEKDHLEAMSVDDQGNVLSITERLKNYRGRLVAMTTCQEDGSALFVLSDAEALGKKSARALDRIMEVAQRLNRITAAEVEQLTGELKNAPSGASGTDLP